MKLTAGGYTKQQLEQREPLVARLKSIGRTEADVGMQIHGLRKRQKEARAARNLAELDRIDEQIIALKKRLLSIAVERERTKDQIEKIKQKAGFQTTKRTWSVRSLMRKLFGEAHKDQEPATTATAAVGRKRPRPVSRTLLIARQLNELSNNRLD